ncbi:hypothetical protein GE21DRAFT_1215752, partial [Neurospora crassa]
LVSNNNNRYYISKTNILNNPYIAIYYFIRRFKFFEEYILILTFKFNNFSNYWRSNERVINIYTNLTNIQNKLKPYKYFIINKKSILNIRTIYYINAHLRQAFVENQGKKFSSTNILLLKDFFQLIPMK